MKLTILPLVAALLVGCGQKPVNVPVPHGPSILHGSYSGEAIEYRGQEPTGRRLPASLRATATYVSAKEYHSSGTLMLGETTYSFAGQGQGNSLVRFTPQYTPHYPTIYFAGDVLLGTRKAGRLRWGSGQGVRTTDQALVLELEDDADSRYLLLLKH